MATIKDVAHLAGVSVGTASMVVNGSSSVKMETRFKVLKAIETLHYVPNQYARSLVTNQKKVLGVVHEIVSPDTDVHRGGQRFNEIPDTYLADMLDVIVRETSTLGYSLLLDVAIWSSATDPMEWKLPQFIQPSRIDGCIWAGGSMTSRHEELLAQMGLPLVSVGSRHELFDWVDSDYDSGMYQMTKYVLDCGHRDIVFINGLDTTQTSARKLNGVARALDEKGIELCENGLEKAAFSAISGYNAMKRLWDRGVRPSAVITAMDVVAIGAMRFLNEMGLRVPQDVSVTGFEDGLLAEHCFPRLTTVNIDKISLATQSCHILANRIDNPKAKQVCLVIEPKLAIRETVRRL